MSRYTHHLHRQSYQRISPLTPTRRSFSAACAFLAVAWGWHLQTIAVQAEIVDSGNSLANPGEIVWGAQARNFDADDGPELLLGHPGTEFQGSTDHKWSGAGMIDRFQLVFKPADQTAELTAFADGTSASDSDATRLVYTLNNPGEFDELVIQATATEGALSIFDTELTLANGDSFTYFSDKTDQLIVGGGGDPAMWVRIGDLPALLSDGFTLTGAISSSFEGALNPTGQTLDFLFTRHPLDTGEPNPIPEPQHLLLWAFMLVVGYVWRQRQNKLTPQMP